MLAILLSLVAFAIVTIVVLYKHSDELGLLIRRMDAIWNVYNRSQEKISEVDNDLTDMVEAVHDNIKELSLHFGEMKKLFLLGNTSLDLKEIIRAQPERIFDGNAFVQKFLHRAKRLAEKYQNKKEQKKKFKSLYSKSLTEPDHNSLREEQH
jgi:hypothetical protein